MVIDGVNMVFYCVCVVLVSLLVCLFYEMRCFVVKQDKGKEINEVVVAVVVVVVGVMTMSLR